MSGRWPLTLEASSTMTDYFKVHSSSCVSTFISDRESSSLDLGPHDLSINLLLLLTVRGRIHHLSWNVQARHGWRLKTWDLDQIWLTQRWVLSLAPFVRPYNKEGPSMSLQVNNSLLFTQLAHSWNSWPVSQCFGPWLEQQLFYLPMYRFLHWIDYDPQTTITSATPTSIGKTEIVL